MTEPLRPTSDLVTQAHLHAGDDEGGGPVLHAHVAGEINLHNSPVLRGDLLGLVANAGPRAVVLNLREVPYMDSSAMAVLIEVLKAVRGGGVYVTELQSRVSGLLHIARLDSILTVADTDASALAALGVAADGKAGA